MDFKKVLGKKKEDEQEDDTILFDLNPEKLQDDSEKGLKRGVQSFTVAPEVSAPPQNEKQSKETAVESAGVNLTETGSDEAQPTAVNEQLQDLSSNLKNLVYDFRSFMSEAGSPFNPNDIPVGPGKSDQAAETGQPGYISANNAGATVTETVENPSDIQSGLENRFISPTDKEKLSRLLEPPKKKSDALKQFSDVLNAHQLTKFATDLKSNLDSTDMPALIRAVNSTDYLLHAVGRKNLLKILEVGTREGWIRPEVERIVLSVAEVLSTAGVETDDRIINVNDLLRVVYFLNRLLDPQISDFLSISPSLLPKKP